LCTYKRWDVSRKFATGGVQVDFYTDENCGDLAGDRGDRGSGVQPDRARREWIVAGIAEINN
jgi:hypothetical protein